MELTPIQFKPYKWLDEAVIFNKRNERVPVAWIKENADIIVLLFTAKGVDKDGIIEKFYQIYETVKFINMPVEVIYVPMDESNEDMVECYEKQANWFTLAFHDPLVHVLKYMYNVSCIPHVIVIRPDCTVVSHTGIMDLETYGKNATITWLSDTVSAKCHRNLNKEIEMYGDKWKFQEFSQKKDSKAEYQRRFSTDESNK